MAINCCSTCGQEAELSDDRLCVTCYDRMVDRSDYNYNAPHQKEYHRRYYLANREGMIAKATEYRTRIRQGVTTEGSRS